MPLFVAPVGDVPDELGQDVEDGDEEVGHGEVEHEAIHARRRLPAQLPAQRQQHHAVAQQRHQEDDDLQEGAQREEQQEEEIEDNQIYCTGQGQRVRALQVLTIKVLRSLVSYHNCEWNPFFMARILACNPS